MQGQVMRHSVHLHGTLAANALGYIYFQSGGTLKAVSGVASNDSAATLKLGTAADDDGIFVAAAIGDSGVPVVWDKGDWGGALNTLGADENYYVAPGTTLLWTLDYDGASGTAAQNVTLTFDWIE
jgi:hypothetical protein